VKCSQEEEGEKKEEEKEEGEKQKEEEDKKEEVQVKRTGFFTLFSRNKDASVVVSATTPEKGPEENKPDEVDEGKEGRRYS
jgi:hypothetical protein